MGDMTGGAIMKPDKHSQRADLRPSGNIGSRAKQIPDGVPDHHLIPTSSENFIQIRPKKKKKKKSNPCSTSRVVLQQTDSQTHRQKLAKTSSSRGLVVVEVVVV